MVVTLFGEGGKDLSGISYFQTFLSAAKTTYRSEPSSQHFKFHKVV